MKSPHPASSPNQTSQEPKSTGRRKLPIVLLCGLGLLLAAGAGVALIASGGNYEAASTNAPSTTVPNEVPFADPVDDEDASTTTTSSETESPSTSAQPQGIGEPEGTVDPAGTAEPVTDSGAAGFDSPPIPLGAPSTHSVLSGGKIYLRGNVPSEAIEGLIVAAIEPILGPGNVVSEYTVDPAALFDPGRSAPVYIEDTVLFTSGSSEISADFQPILGLGLTLMQLQPGVTLDVFGHTDSAGSAEGNLSLSQSRVDAVKEFYVSQGIGPDRINAVGKGETEPRADNATAEGRQANRRVQFVVNGFSVNQ